MKRITAIFLVFLPVFAFYACGDRQNEATPVEEDAEELTLDYSCHKLPDRIEWLTNNDDPITGSPDAKREAP